MTNCYRKLLLWLSALALLFVNNGSASAGLNNSFAYGINNYGHVVGRSQEYFYDIDHAVLWSNGVAQDLGKTYGRSSASGINDSGQVVGFTETNGDRFATLLNNGVSKNLGTLGGSGSEALRINNAGQIVGYSYTTGDNAISAALWNNGIVHELGSLGGGFEIARDINNAGQIVGYSAPSVSLFHAVSWNNGAIHDLGTLGGTSSFAEAINDLGQVVGRSDTASAGTHATLWSSGNIQDLGVLDNSWWGAFSSALDINNSGQIVGFSNSGGGNRATLWEYGVAIDLNYLITNSDWRLEEASGINDNGQITGTAQNWATGDYAAFLITANSVSLLPDPILTHYSTIPEPSTLTLLGAGTLIAGLIRKRLKR